MVIVTQSNVIVCRYRDIYIGNTEYSWNTIVASPEIDCEDEYFLGEYSSLGRCQEVLKQIIDAYKKNLPVFEMPRK